jgi:hypothetical protein
MIRLRARGRIVMRSHGLYLDGRTVALTANAITVDMPIAS